MGLTNSSTGINVVDLGLEIKKQNPDDKVVALQATNVGKSTYSTHLQDFISTPATGPEKR